jgi:hypothetical protein
MLTRRSMRPVRVTPRDLWEWNELEGTQGGVDIVYMLSFFLSFASAAWGSATWAHHIMLFHVTLIGREPIPPVRALIAAIAMTCFIWWVSTVARIAKHVQTRITETILASKRDLLRKYGSIPPDEVGVSYFLIVDQNP